MIFLLRVLFLTSLFCSLGYSSTTEEEELAIEFQKTKLLFYLAQRGSFSAGWVIPTLINLGDTLNSDNAPEICRTPHYKDCIAILDKFDFEVTELAPLKLQGDLAYLFGDTNPNLKKYLVKQAIMWLKQLEFGDDIHAIAKNFSSKRAGSLKSIIQIILAEKKPYCGYCETMREWHNAGSELKEMPPALLTYFVGVVKKIALYYQLDQEYDDFIRRLDLRTIDTSIDISVSPYERLKTDFNDELRSLDVLPYLDTQTQIVLNPDQQMIATVSRELTLVGILERLTMDFSIPEGSIGPFHIESEGYHRASQMFSHILERELKHDYDIIRKNEGALLEKAITLMQTNQELILSQFERAFMISHAFNGVNLEEIKKSFISEFLIRAPMDGIYDRIMLPSLVRTLKFLSVKLKVERKFNAWIEMHDLQEHAPSEDDARPLFEWWRDRPHR